MTTARIGPGLCALNQEEPWALSHVQSIFGGTTEIQKEIIARGLGL